MSKRSNVSFEAGLTMLAAMSASSGRKHHQFDWDKAAQLIKERNAKNAEAGLAEDWGWTGGYIFKNGKPVPRDSTYVYLSSNWATPLLVLDGEEIECWKEGDDAEEFWPQSALEILGKT